MQILTSLYPLTNSFTPHSPTYKFIHLHTQPMTNSLFSVHLRWWSHHKLHQSTSQCFHFPSLLLQETGQGRWNGLFDPKVALVTRIKNFDRQKVITWLLSYEQKLLKLDLQWFKKQNYKKMVWFFDLGFLHQLPLIDNLILAFFSKTYILLTKYFLNTIQPEILAVN